MDDTYIKTSCPTCETAFRVRAALVGPAGSRARCRMCGGAFAVRPHSVPSVWVFVDDPAFQVPATVRALQDVRGANVVLLDRDARQALVGEAFTSRPAAVVFGDMHVILEDGLLERVCEGSEATRILVSTHQNQDMVDAARSFCGFDHHLVLPLASSLLQVVLEDACANAVTR